MYRANPTGRTGRSTAVAVALAFVVAVLAAPYSPALAVVAPATDECTETIPGTVDTVDGDKDYGHVGPGAVICLPAGTRGNLRLFNLHGTADRPIIVRNADGRVSITGEQFGEGGIIIAGSSFIRVTGSAIEDHCGADFSSDDQRCGIVIDGARKGIKLITDKGDLHDIEIDHIAVAKVSQEVKTRGIAIHPLPGQVIGGIHIHHNLVTNTLAEGIYVGTEPHDQAFEMLAKVERVSVHHNLVENTGYDGIKIKVAVRDVAVYNNVVLNAGISRTPAHTGGIKIAFSVGDYFNNTVIGAVEGIHMGRTLESPGTRYFNNLVVDVVEVAISVPEDGAQIFNNTVIRSAGIGISATGLGAIMTDNIIADARTPITASRAHTARNLVGSASAIGFAPDGHGLRSDLPAVDGGRRCGQIPAIDRAGGARPAGERVDIGAFELGAVAMPPSSERAALMVYYCEFERPIRRTSGYVV